METDVTRLEKAIECRNLIEIWRIMRKISHRMEVCITLNLSEPPSEYQIYRVCEILNNCDIKDPAIMSERDRLIQLAELLKQKNQKMQEGYPSRGIKT